MSLLTAGLTVARYDSTDGYPAHPRESGYHAAQIATLTANGAVTTVACQVTADATEQYGRAGSNGGSGPPPAVDEWWKQFTSRTNPKNNANGHPRIPFSRDNPAEAAIYDWFANCTGDNGDGVRNGPASE
ncbi:hypothetical protein [Microbacterium sp. cf046]|uniref:hypothetical protein n=1 Tax=Microbacterium sp. cf046 TaxID=1761803 RepID=UPI00111370B6|nr:hypothetical protein [Microbacterium sp. cf046]